MPPHFTLVFEGDITKFKFNPLKQETAFGVPLAASVGNALEDDRQTDAALGASPPMTRRPFPFPRSTPGENAHFIFGMMMGIAFTMLVVNVLIYVARHP